MCYGTWVKPSGRVNGEQIFQRMQKSYISYARQLKKQSKTYTFLDKEYTFFKH